ncbi:MAG TPA: hypothetical protein VJB67_02945 [Patescibacteria group bacterium]|nr:hypothetical protein [Patescibacteria group bacterium]
MNQKPNSKWIYLALTPFPDSQTRSGTIKASNLEEATAKVRRQNLFPIMVELAPGETPKNVQARAAARSLDKSDTVRRLMITGKVVPLAKQKK